MDNKEKINEILLEEKQKKEQNQNEFMTFKNGESSNEQINENWMNNKQSGGNDNYINYQNEINRNINNNFNNNPYYYNNNINYNEYDINEQIEDNVNNVQEIILGNRRIERFDGAECNNNNKVREKQNINTQFFNKEQEIQDNNIQEFITFNNYNKKIRNNEMNYNNINQMNTDFKQDENEYLSGGLNNNIDNNPYNQNIENYLNNNLDNFSNQDNSEGTIKEKTNYKLYSSNNCKEEKYAYVSINYKESEKTTFMNEKKENNMQNNNFVLKNDKEQYPQNHKVFISTNIRTINGNPQNQNEIQNQRILLQNNIEQNNIIPQQYNKQPQVIIKELQNLNQNSNINENNNFCQNEKKNNNNIDVLYHKDGYGNEEYIQKKLKKKRKKKIIYIRHKPIVLQHFDFKIIQKDQEALIPQEYRHYQLQPNIQQKNYISDFNQVYPIQENIVPPVQNRHQNQYVYNSSQLVKIYPPQKESLFNCNYHRPYTPILRNKRSIPMRSYGNEEDKQFNYKSPYRPKQTIISLTPMKTINQPNSPFIENKEIPNNNKIRYFIRERRNKEYRALTPPNYSHNFERQYDFENNYNYYNNNYGNKRRRIMNDYSFHHKNKYIESRQELFDDNQEEDNNEEDCPCCIYERRGQIMENMH